MNFPGDISELLVKDVMIACFYLLAIASQWNFYRRTGAAFLRMGAIALVCSLCAEILGTAAVAFDSSIFLYLSDAANLVFCFFLYGIFLNLAGEKVSLRLMGLTTLASIVLVLAALVTGAPESAIVAGKVPGALLLVYGAIIMLRGSTPGPGHFALLVLVALYITYAAGEPLLPPDLLGQILSAYVSALIVLLIGALLPMIAAEQMIRNLRRQEDRLSQVEQEKRRLEMQFSQAQKHESLGVMAGGIAHDFNNMLTSILGYTTLAMKKLPPESEARKDLYMVMSGVRQAVDLTSQMLVYAGKSAVEFESVNLTTVIDDMSGLVNSIVPRKIRLVRNMGAGLPLIKGDPVQIGQVVMNLVANGIDAIQHGIGTIELTTGIADVSKDDLARCWFAEDHEPGAFVFLRVSDTGVGIEQDHVERIFDPFYSEKSRGRGLGLSSLSGIVRQHKGFVEVDSTRGVGTHFTVYFPIIAYRDSDLLRSGSGLPASTMPKQRVLLADDDPRIRSLIVSILESDGYDIVDVEDGREASRYILETDERFDLLLLDCTMPKKSGPEVYREARAAGLDVPVVLISGYQQEQVLSDISRDANASFMKKPFSVDELLERVRSVISHAHAGD